jgi:hypothetical protein
MTTAAKPEQRTSVRPGDVTYAPRKPEPIIAGCFTPRDNTIAEIIAAATALERVGYEPKLKVAGNGDDPQFIHLVVDDVADIMTKLRSSIASNPKVEQ